MNQIKMLLGANGIKQAYEQTLTSAIMDVKCLSTNYKRILGEWFDNQYWPKVLKSNVKTREIIINSEANRKYAQNLNQNKNQAGFIEKEKQTETDFVITDNQVIFISYDLSNPYALVIEDKEMVKSMKIQFDLMWKSADK